MIPILYEPTETAFTSNGLGRLPDATACVVHEQRNGCFETTIEMPTTGLHFSEIQKGSFIKATPSPTRPAQIFEVVSITKKMDGMMAEIYCQHISYRLNRIPVKPYTAASAYQALSRMISNSVEANPFTAYSDVTRSGTYRHTVPSSAKACLQGEAGSILQVYQGEYLFNNYDIRLLANRGVDRGTEIRFGKNLLELEMEESLEGVITGIMPYWEGKSGETDVIMMLPEYVVYSSHASDFPNARTEVVDFSGEFSSQPTEEELRSAANSYIDRNNIGVPKVDWDVEFATLAQTTEYSGIALLERMDLCDIVTIIFQDFGISVKAKIVETWYDALNDRYQKVHIGDQRFTLAQTIASTAAQIEQSEAKQTTIFTQALEQATALLNGDLSGSSLKTITDSSGNPTGLIIMDTTNPMTAINCILINAAGIGFSNSGPDGPYTSAWTIDNTLNMQNINVIHINADNIDAGTLSADRVSGGTLKGVTAEFGTSTQAGYPAIKIFSTGVLQMYAGSSANLQTTQIYGLDYAYTRQGLTSDSTADASWWISNDESAPTATYHPRIGFFADKIVGWYNNKRFQLQGINSGGQLILYAPSTSSYGSTVNQAIRLDASNSSISLFRKADFSDIAVLGNSSTFGGQLILYDQNGAFAVLLDRSGLQFYQNGTLVKRYGP